MTAIVLKYSSAPDDMMRFFEECMKGWLRTENRSIENHGSLD